MQSQRETSSKNQTPVMNKGRDKTSLAKSTQERVKGVILEFCQDLLT